LKDRAVSWWAWWAPLVFCPVGLLNGNLKRPVYDWFCYSSSQVQGSKLRFFGEAPSKSPPVGETFFASPKSSSKEDDFKALGISEIHQSILSKINLINRD
jgi:hypothetical protein